MNPYAAPEAARIARASLVIGVAFVVFGASFGVLAVSAGASVAQACALSLLAFTGASQMSAVSVIASGGSAASAMGGAVLLAARNTVYGLALAREVEGRWTTRIVGAQWVIDETTALVSAEHDAASRRVAFWVSAPILYAAWNLGTLVGALAGGSIDPETFGLDAAFPVMFTAMVAPHLRTRAGRRAALFGGVVTVALAPLLPVGLPILVASLGMLFGLRPDGAPAPLPSTDGAP